MSSDVSRWNYNQTMKFINLLRSYPVIWDQDHQHFRNKFQRELAYDVIAYEMNTNNDGIKKKIHTLRSQYRVEYNKLMAKKHYKPRWQYFEPLQFIYKHDNIKFETPISLDKYRNQSLITNNDNSTSQDNDDACNEAENNYNEDGSGSERSLNNNSKMSSVVNSESDVEIENDNTEPRKRSRLDIKYVEEIESEDELDSNLKDIISNSPIQDEFTIFGETIATELRLLKDHHIIHDTLRLKIERAIKEAKYAMYKARNGTI